MTTPNESRQKIHDIIMEAKGVDAQVEGYDKFFAPLSYEELLAGAGEILKELRAQRSTWEYGGAVGSSDIVYYHYWLNALDRIHTHIGIRVVGREFSELIKRSQREWELTGNSDWQQLHQEGFITDEDLPYFKKLFESNPREEKYDLSEFKRPNLE